MDADALRELADDRLQPHEDHRGFPAQYPEGAILDEVKRERALLSYVKASSTQTRCRADGLSRGRKVARC
ncbi:MAG: hypothetical protein OXN84_13775 [Albidovulum sp.]|nr:hypothetical protein [Albidovulum sp.]